MKTDDNKPVHGLLAGHPGTTLSELPHSRAYICYVLGLLALVNVFNYMDRFVFSVLMELLKKDFDVLDTQLGALTGFAFALTYAIFGFLFARWADRGSRVNILSMAMGIWSLATVLCGLAWNFVSLFFARVAVGFGEAGGIPSTHSLISDYFRPERRATAMAIVTAGTFVGIALGNTLGGYIGENFGWRMAFVLAGAPGLLFAVVLKLTLREPPRQTAKSQHIGEGDVPFVTVLKTLFSRPAYAHLVLAVTIAVFASIASIQWAPAFFMRSHGLTLTQVGAVTGFVNGVGQVVALIIGGVLADRLARRDLRWQLWAPGIGMILSLPFFAAAYLAESWILAAFMFLLAGLAAGAVTGPLYAAIQSLANADMRAMAVAVIMFAASILGYGMGPLVIGVLSDYFSTEYGQDGLRYALLSSLAFSIWGAIHIHYAARHFLADAADAATGRVVQ